MSGQAGASRQGRFYAVTYMSGIFESFIPPDDVDADSYVSRLFEEMSKPYEESLEKAAPHLDELFNNIAGKEGFPLVEVSGSNEWIYGVVIEDTGEFMQNRTEIKHGRNWLVNSKGKAACVRFDIDFNPDSFKIISVDIAVNDQIKRSGIDYLKKEIKKIFEGVFKETNDI